MSAIKNIQNAQNAQDLTPKGLAKKNYTKAQVDADEKRGIWHTSFKIKGAKSQAIKNIEAVIAKYESVSPRASCT